MYKWATVKAKPYLRFPGRTTQSNFKEIIRLTLPWYNIETTYLQQSIACFRKEFENPPTVFCRNKLRAMLVRDLMNADYSKT